ncbi:hypothetical protein HMPREF9439_00239 [Parasutterella excrementihominis YIT 11859]|uniref:Uncharacterized protein n=1 Tax=Parasutterella excrementihominis YIT 11859 TaxID=762966 RepID=F3QH48_9BURK|nr:hypothetical protein HMPREF9439_00239 [Parasutterella excrementihominis YIT 11859]
MTTNKRFLVRNVVNRISESFKSKHQDHFVMFAFLIRGGEE